MKKGLLSSTALVAATVLGAGVAAAAEAPTYKVNGNMQFMLLNESQDFTFANDHGYYFAVVDPEVKVTMTGTADNGLGYGFKVELNAETNVSSKGGPANSIADEVVAQFSGSWGRLEMGDEDGAEDTMQLGGESVMGGSGGIDGSYGLVLSGVNFVRTGPGIVGDTSDSTKVTYYTPNFSGLSAGVSFTPTQHDGDQVGNGGAWEDSIGLGVKYEAEMGGMSIAASGVYVTAAATALNTDDVSSWSVGGKIGFGPAVVGASYTDSGSSLTNPANSENDSYWNVGVGYTAGPIYVSAGYAAYSYEVGTFEATRDVISLTADYSVAPGLTTYGEVVMSSEDLGGAPNNNDATILILGASLSF